MTLPVEPFTPEPSRQAPVDRARYYTSTGHEKTGAPVTGPEQFSLAEELLEEAHKLLGVRATGRPPLPCGPL